MSAAGSSKPAKSRKKAKGNEEEEHEGLQEAAPMDTDPPVQRAKAKLPANLELQRTHLIVGPEMNRHTATVTSANAYLPLGIDNAWNLAEFKADFQIKVNRLDSEVIQFDIIGIDPAVVNALRRILIAEVPTVAIENVYIINNTSIIQDEVLSHRLGLVPLKVDPALLELKTAEEAPSEKNTLVFKLDITCRREGELMVNDKVLSRHLSWVEAGSEMPEETGCRFAQQGQGHMFKEAPPRPVHDDILLAKLRPGQSIQLEAHCIKGIGKDHAKWSPVATAWYTLLPEVVLLKEPDEVQAEVLLGAAPGLFTRGLDGKLIVGQAREHALHLEKVRALLEQPSMAEVVQYRKRKEHFIFTIESTGAIPPEVLFQQALDILHDKADRLTRLCY